MVELIYRPPVPPTSEDSRTSNKASNENKNFVKIHFHVFYQQCRLSGFDNMT